MKEEKTYILGGGIAGLVWAFYNKGMVISPEFGGQMASHFPLGPRYLHKNEYSLKFMQDIGLPIEVIKITTGYQTSSEVLSEIPSQEYKQEYYKKSRGRQDLLGFDDTAMSSGKNNFEAIKVDFEKLIKLLVEKLQGRLISGKVQEILAEKKMIVTDQEIYEYDAIVNTMPLNIFSKIYNGAFPAADNFKCEAITYVWLKPQAKGGFDYVYVPDKTIKHHRITYDEKGLICEWFGQHSKEECKQAYGDDYIDSQILYSAQIIPFEKPINADGVVFVGRYGTWNRHWKTEKVIEEAIKFKTKSERNSWDEYFIKITNLVSERATCLRARHGALLVKNNKIIASGYNGSPSGMPQCNEVGCMLVSSRCIRTIHAEQNALLQAGEEAKGSKLYCTGLSCPVCIKLLLQAGVTEIIYIDDGTYKADDVEYWIKNSKIKVTKWKS